MRKRNRKWRSLFIFVAVMLKWKNDGTAAIEEMPDRHTDF